LVSKGGADGLEEPAELGALREQILARLAEATAEVDALETAAEAAAAVAAAAAWTPRGALVAVQAAAELETTVADLARAQQLRKEVQADLAEVEAALATETLVVAAKQRGDMSVRLAELQVAQTEALEAEAKQTEAELVKARERCAELEVALTELQAAADELAEQNAAEKAAAESIAAEEEEAQVVYRAILLFHVRSLSGRGGRLPPAA
jgi:chromosome segregation ATPase